jgi:tetratricopeptide (TPR) repeat protein
MRARLFLPAIAITLSAQSYNPRADLEAGRFLKVMAESNAILQKEPQNAPALAGKSQALSSQQRFNEALDIANQALGINGNLADAHLAKGLALAGAALRQRNLGSLGKVGEAMDELRTAVAQDASLVPAWMSLGLGYQQLPGIVGGSTRKALKCAESLRQVNAAKGDLLQGMILSMGGKWSQAEPYFGRALAAAPGDPEIVAGYLDSLSSRETREALGEGVQKPKLAQEAQRLLPAVKGRAKAIEAVSDAFIDAGRPEEAWKLVQSSIAVVDAPSILRLQLGKVAARTGLHPDEGLAALDHVLKEPLEGGSGGYPAAHWRRAQILKDQGKTDLARQAAQAALKLDPKHPGAKRLLSELN